MLESRGRQQAIDHRQRTPRTSLYPTPAVSDFCIYVQQPAEKPVGQIHLQPVRQRLAKRRISNPFDALPDLAKTQDGQV